MGTALSTMVTNIAGKLEDPSFRFWTAANIKRAIGEAYRFYAMKMVELGEGYFETSTPLNLVVNTEAISIAALSPVFWSISQLERVLSDGSTIPLQPNERRYEPNNAIGTGVGDNYRPDYKRRGTNIILEPKPTFSEAGGLKLDYVFIPTFPTSTSADSFSFDANFQTIYEVNVELRAMVKLLESKDAVGGVSDISTFRQELEALDESFLETIESDEFPDRVAFVGINYNLR